MMGLTRGDEMLPPVHRDGIPWTDAPKPRRFHRCTAWTTAGFRSFHVVERCACGAIRVGTPGPDVLGGPGMRRGRWQERNTR